MRGEVAPASGTELWEGSVELTWFTKSQLILLVFYYI